MREATKDKTDPCGTTLEEGRRTTEKAMVVELCFGRERHSADWAADGQKASSISCNMNSMSVLRAGTVDLNDADFSAYFHDVSVAIQDAREKTQDHANDERPTRKAVFEEPQRCSFVSQWTTKMVRPQRMRSCTHVIGEEACPVIEKNRE